MKSEFLWQIFFEKQLNMNFQKPPSSGSQTVPRRWIDGQTDGRTDRQTGLIVPFLQLCEHS